MKPPAFNYADYLALKAENEELKAEIQKLKGEKNMAKIETYENCTVEVVTDEASGNISVGWYKNDEKPMRMIVEEEGDRR